MQSIRKLVLYYKSHYKSALMIHTALENRRAVNPDHIGIRHHVPSLRRHPRLHA